MTYKDIPGYCDFHDFYKQVFDSLPEHAIIAEVGVFLGHSVAYMATLSKESGKDIAIWAFDRKRGIDISEQKVKENLRNCNVHYHVLVKRIASVEAANNSLAGEYDFVFIDAAHDYDSVKADIQAWLPKVKPGGIIAGHDYCDAWPGVKKAVDELIPDRQLTSKSVWWKRLEQTY
jgi:predicted O-methyltransferase YrrM